MTPTELIDDMSHDHDEISDIVRSLRAALEGRDYGRARSLLLSLEVVEARHYSAESELMRAVAYDQADAHLAEHAGMLETLTRINRVLGLEGTGSVSPKIVAHLEAALAHMIDADAKLIRFVAARR
jgi:hemerythrin